MKQFFMDLCLVLLLICVIGLYFDDYRVSQTMFQRSIDDFEEQIDQGEVISQQVVLTDTKDNQVSLVLKTLSDWCVKVIQFVVLIFSDFISMILMVVVY